MQSQMGMDKPTGRVSSRIQGTPDPGPEHKQQHKPHKQHVGTRPRKSLPSPPAGEPYDAGRASSTCAQPRASRQRRRLYLVNPNCDSAPWVGSPRHVGARSRRRDSSSQYAIAPRGIREIQASRRSGPGEARSRDRFCPVTRATRRGNGLALADLPNLIGPPP